YHAGPKAARTAISEHEGTGLSQNILIRDKVVAVGLGAVPQAAPRDEIAVERLSWVVRLGGHG
ncbi:MAG TPA: hypothetical protein VFG22_08185, partial [Polyangiales bacterium]|nr:hypothetical protein [Polyangiales bacterium]